MTPIDGTPLEDRGTIDLREELDARRRQPQVLGNIERIVDLEFELDLRVREVMA